MKDSDSIARQQLEDLATLGIDHDGPIVYQKDRTGIYEDALVRLGDLVYECFCSRKDITEAAQAPHGVVPKYPGTCRDLSESQKASLRKLRPPSLRINACSAPECIADQLLGSYADTVDDFVVRRADGVFAYNFAVVVDDGLQDVDQVVRGADLLDSSPRQAWLASQLGFRVPEYLHVPLVIGLDNTRLAKREKAVSLAQLHQQGISTTDLLSMLAASLGLASAGEKVTVAMLIDRFDPAKLPREPWQFTQLLAPGKHDVDQEDHRGTLRDS